jgi:hypothetical protein
MAGEGIRPGEQAGHTHLPRLLLPSDMPSVPGLDVPGQLYWVLLEPAPLAGMADPRDSSPWQDLYAAGLVHVVCLIHDTFPYHPVPLHPLLSVRLQDLAGGRTPRDSDREEGDIHRLSLEITHRIERGEGVVVHCAAGTGRTGTVLGCVLRLLGHGSAQVLDYLNRLNMARGHGGWPESPWQASVVQRIARD